MKKIKIFFKYIEPAWQGNDGKISLRAVLAIAFSIDFIRNLSFAITKWAADRSLEGLSLTLGIEAGLIVALLGLSTYQNMAANKTSVEVNNPGGGGAIVKVEAPLLGKQPGIESSNS